MYWYSILFYNTILSYSVCHMNKIYLLIYIWYINWMNVYLGRLLLDCLMKWKMQVDFLELCVYVIYVWSRFLIERNFLLGEKKEKKIGDEF